MSSKKSKKLEKKLKKENNFDFKLIFIKIIMFILSAFSLLFILGQVNAMAKPQASMTHR